MMKKLHLDIESAPNEGYFWDPKTRFITSDKVIETSRVLCLAYKWEGDKKIHFLSEWGDTDMILETWMMLNEADAVITYNGNRFDLPVLNREFLKAGLSPPKPYATIDLFRTVKSQFKFTHSSLGAVCTELGIGSKASHPGFQMWVDVMNGSEKARARMEKYNRQDVRLLPDLYRFLRPWIKNHPNEGLYKEGTKKACPSCGSHSLTKQGLRVTKTQTYQQYQCGTCGSWSRDRLTSLPADRRSAILVGA